MIHQYIERHHITSLKVYIFHAVKPGFVISQIVIDPPLKRV